jgi:hypothetical protein
MRKLRSLYVAVLLFCGSTAEIVNSPLNHSVVFIREAELVLTSNHWRVTVNFDLSTYEEAITVLREDLTHVEGLAKHSTPIGELRQVDLALNSFEDTNLKRYLPKANRKRGWIDARGSILRVIFRTATMLDLDELHSTVDNLHKKQDSIVHAVNQQVSYFRQLDGAVKFNYQAIANLSATLIDIALRTQQKFQETSSKMELAGHYREAAIAIRALEFVLTQLELSIEQLLVAMQYVMISKTPVNLVNPVMLQEILRNVSLVLPEGYELIVGNDLHLMYWYYDIIQATMLVDLHGFKLILNIPIKSVNRHYDLYQVVTLPTRILNRKRNLRSQRVILH